MKQNHLELRMKTIRICIIGIIILTVVLSIVVFPHMADPVPSHWNAAGTVDGYLPKFWGLILVPSLMIGFCALFALLPRIDPLRENYQKFGDYYEMFILIFAAFLFFIQLQIILWGMGIHVSPNLTMPVMIGILFIYIGFLMEHAEPNWFVGIRTPWTLSSDSVWKKTHQKGATLFKLAGVVSMIGILAGVYAWLFILVPTIAVAVYTVVYSYFEFKREQRSGVTE
jgi:uncharacterized membrane protein